MNNEMNWIRSIAPTEFYQQGKVKVGIGDDAAVIGQEEETDSIIAVDTMVEGVHFKKETMPLQAIGYKALAANISDIAAMGGIPLYYLVSIAIPKTGWTKEELDEIYKGMARLGDRYSMDLIGGDTVSIKENLVLSVTIIGKIEKNRQLLRTNAKPGDIVFVTGPLGLSSVGLEMLLEHGLSASNKLHMQEYIHTHQEPIPQVEAGRLLANCGYRITLDDISDGLASEAKEIAEASEVDVELDWDKIPTTDYIKSHSLEKQEAWVLYGGEDYQLLGTVSKDNWRELESIFEKENKKLYSIGIVHEGSGQVRLVRDGKKKVLTKTGYDHL